MRWKTARKRERRNHWKRLGHLHINLKNCQPVYGPQAEEAYEYQFYFQLSRGYLYYPNH